jgi:transcriptional regulator with XRE-family HTH domain
MPRPNRPRHIGGESSLADRIAFERESRKMSYDGLASRMEKAGCPINASAIYKIEKANPPRRITVDELVGFSRVFELPIEDLLLPAHVVKQSRLLKGLDEIAECFFALRGAQDDYDASVAKVSELADGLGFRLTLPAPSAADVTAETVWIVDIGGTDSDVQH